MTTIKNENFKITSLRNNRCWQGCGEKETLVHCWWECKLVQSLWKTVWRFLKKVKIELPYDPSILLLSIYPRKMKTLTQKDIWMASRQILSNIQRRANTYPSQTLPKYNRGRNTPKLILQGHHHPDTKTRRGCHKKKKITGQYH